MFAMAFTSSLRSLESTLKEASRDLENMNKEVAELRKYDAVLKHVRDRLAKESHSYPKTLRSYEAVLRIHNSKQKEGHEEFYSELLLFYPWRKERDELKRSHPDDCIKMYQENISVIYKNKSSELSFLRC